MVEPVKRRHAKALTVWSVMSNAMGGRATGLPTRRPNDQHQGQSGTGLPVKSQSTGRVGRKTQPGDPSAATKPQAEKRHQ